MSGKNTSSRSKKPLSVEENSKLFFALFPHRFDYIWAEHARPGEPIHWQTESRHPLSDRLIEQGSYLYGVRFGKKTNYSLIDIDPSSAYHPLNDRLAIRRILETLELLGITRSIMISSSYRGGIHLYLPFAQEQKCGALALAIKTLLEHKGFKVAPGQLEIFPDAKPYTPNSKPKLYNGHRLPLQSGSYILTEDWEPVYSSQREFVQRWQLCQQQNEVTEKRIEQILKIYRREQYKVSNKASKFLNDLQTEIEQGWSDHGQTNQMLGRIAMREYIFGHILDEGAPLEGTDLVQKIVKVATNLPGFNDWCRHKHEIHKRAEEWARAIETSRYFHYGSKNSTLSTLKPEPEENKISWNEQQAQAARDKIREAIAQMLCEGTLPTNTAARFKALTKRKISGSTLYRHRDLWHPSHLEDPSTEPVEIPPDPPPVDPSWGELRKNSPQDEANLLGSDGCNTPLEKDFETADSLQPQIGCNVQAEHLSIFQQVQGAAIQEAIENQKRIRREGQQRRYIEQMQQYLDSGDPILVAEAIAWDQLNPGVLKKMNTNQ